MCARGSPEGDIAYGDAIEVTDTLKDGVVQNLLLVLADGGRLAARRGERKADGSYLLGNAAYTACEVVSADGCPKDPTWEIKAVKVRYDPIKKRVHYDGARVELFGLPVVPLPGLSHPVNDGNASGFLVPDIKFSATNGASLKIPYFIDLGRNRKLTVSGEAFTAVLPMVSANYRQLDENGAFQISGYATYSRLVPLGAATALPGSQNDFRGYVATSGEYRLDKNWSIATAGRYVTDRTFLRRYDISRDDRLRSTINVQRIDADSYFSLAGWAFQTLRPGDLQSQVPVALPALDYRRRFSDPILGGRAQIQVNSLAIARSEGQDTQRAFASARWDLRKLTGLGQLVTFTALARGDIYHSSDNALNPIASYRGASGWQGRAIAVGAVDVEWPFVGSAFGGVQTLKPRIQLVVSPNLANQAIPNEDSRAIDLEDTNLFALNRFPGYDRFEDNSRVTYGLEWNLDRPNLNINTVIGQSYRIANNNNIAPDGTGLSARVSDIAGRTSVRFKDFVKFDHRYRLDKDSLAIRRNEIDVTVGSAGTYAQIGYLRLRRKIDPTLEDLRDREEVRAGGRVQIDANWSVFGSAIVDLTDRSEDPLSLADGFSPIRHRLGVQYDDNCLTMGLTWRYDYENTGDARRGSTFLLTLALRNLGV
ncbi:MAG: LPS assembly protein LptD [Parasphingorhabdus sp.]|nr:LPS assembly protein LptD [Parasphingorhabdus sp.]